MEDKTSIIKLLGLPEPFAVVLLTLSLIMFLAPYFSGADFGLFKIPTFTDSARKKLKIIGPIIFLVLIMLFVPLISRQVPSTSGNANRNDNENKQPDTRNNNALSPTDIRNQAQLHITRAQSLFEQRHYQDAINECDKALGLEPQNQEALDLKKRISNTIEILNRNR